MSGSEEHHHKHTSTREEDQSTDTYREVCSADALHLPAIVTPTTRAGLEPSQDCH